MKHPTQSDHDNARLRRLHTSLHGGGERHDEGAGAIAYGCVGIVFWLGVIVGIVLKGLWR